MKKLALIGLMSVLVFSVILTGKARAEDEVKYETAEDVLEAYQNEVITVDETLELLKQFYEDQIEVYKDNIAEIRRILEQLKNGEIENVAQAIQQINELLRQVDTPDVPDGGKTLDDVAKDKEKNGNENGDNNGNRKGKEVPKKQAKEPPVKDPVVHGTVKGIREIDGKKYAEIEAEEVDILDGKGLQKAEGETWLVEVDDKTAQELENKTGEDIYIAGDIQEDVEGHLTMKMNKNYGGGIVDEDYQNDAWYQENVDKMIESYWKLIEEKYGDKLTYRQKLELLKEILYGGRKL